MTNEMLTRLEGLCAAATPGPWVENVHPLTALWEHGGQDIGNLAHDVDLRFVANARTALPALLSLVRQLQDENAALRLLIAYYVRQSGTPAKT